MEEEEESYQFKFPPELLELVVQFAIPARSFKRALRLRLVNRNFQYIVDKEMFRTRLLDGPLSIVCDDLLHNPEKAEYYRNGDHDTPWFALIKRYYAQRILHQPNITDRRCPDVLFRKAVAILCRYKGIKQGDDTDAVLSITTTVCQVGFWENFCCLHNQYLGYFNYRMFVGTEACRGLQYCNPLALKHLLLNVALYLGDVDLIAQFWYMAPRYPPPNTSALRNQYPFHGHQMIASAHGGLNAFKLLNYLETGIYTKKQYAEEFSNNVILNLVANISKQGGSTRLIHFLLGLDMTWNPNGSWFHWPLKEALLHAHTPDVFEHLAPLGGPHFTPLSSHHSNGLFVSRSTPMGRRLAHHAARNNLVMVKYLVERSSESFLNCPEPAMVDQPAMSIYHRRLTPDYKVANLLVKQQPLYKAVAAGAMELVDYMLEAGADCNISRTSPATALSVAVRRCDLEMVRLLIEKGEADPNRGTPPPIVLAVQAEYPAMVYLLLQKGAVLDTPKSGGWAMTIAEEFGLDSMKKLLIGLGVKAESMHSSPYARKGVDYEQEAVRELMCPGPWFLFPR